MGGARIGGVKSLRREERVGIVGALLEHTCITRIVCFLFLGWPQYTHYRAIALQYTSHADSACVRRNTCMWMAASEVRSHTLHLCHVYPFGRIPVTFCVTVLVAHGNVCLCMCT